MLKAKFKACLLHAVLTLVSASLASLLIFLLWYPGELLTLAGGTKIFFVVCGVEVVLGPLMSLVIYNTKKSRKELLTDYSIVLVIQLAAFGYGIHSAYIARPLYLAFVVDRFELVSQVDLDEEGFSAYRDFAKQSDLKKDPLRLAIAEMPADIDARNQLIFASTQGGKDLHLMPEYFVKYDGVRVLKKSGDLPDLKNRLAQAKFEEGRKQVDEWPTDGAWLPVMTKFGVWTALLDKENGRPVEFIKLDPF